MKKFVLVLIAAMSTVVFAENNGLTGGGSSYDNYSGGYEPAPRPATPVSVPPKNYLKTCVAYTGVTYQVSDTSIDMQGQPVAKLSLQPNGSLVSADGKYQVFLSSNILLLDNSLVINCR